MKRCPACGKNVEDGLKFCVWCGTALTGEESPETPPPLPPAKDPGEPREAGPPATPGPPPLPQTQVPQAPAAPPKKTTPTPPPVPPLDASDEEDIPTVVLPASPGRSTPSGAEPKGPIELKPTGKPHPTGQSPVPPPVGTGLEAQEGAGAGRFPFWTVAAAVILLGIAIGVGGWLFSRRSTRMAVASAPGAAETQAASEPGSGPGPVEKPASEAQLKSRPTQRPTPDTQRSSRRNQRTRRHAGTAHPPVSPAHHDRIRVTSRSLPLSGFIEGSVDVSEFPAWPAPSATLYSKKRYRGRSQLFGVGQVPHLGGTRIRDNAATSVRIEGGARLILYLKPNFIGRHETFTGDCPSLTHRKIRNNRASSLRVLPPDIGSLRWRAGPVIGLALAFTIERRSRGAVVQPEGGPAYWIVPSSLPGARGTLLPLLASKPQLATALGSPLGGAVLISNGSLAVQVFRHGVMVYAPRSLRAWYRLDTSGRG